MERRNKSRYPIAQTVQWRGKESFAGVTRDISSGGAFIVSGTRPTMNQRIELRIEWPALLNGSIPLMLVTWARVERVERNGFAVSFDTVQFRTTKRPVDRAATPVVQSIAS
jgi:hypothetical protein